MAAALTCDAVTMNTRKMTTWLLRENFFNIGFGRVRQWILEARYVTFGTWLDHYETYTVDIKFSF
jgi:hypothetical protein